MGSVSDGPSVLCDPAMDGDGGGQEHPGTSERHRTDADAIGARFEHLDGVARTTDAIFADDRAAIASRAQIANPLTDHGDHLRAREPSPAEGVEWRRRRAERGHLIHPDRSEILPGDGV